MAKNTLAGNRNPSFGDKSRKEDSLELARIIYDIFKENQANGNIHNGQNNAMQSNHT